MGIVERKQREKEERKSLILQKTKALILERGLPALSMQDIADASELSKASLYLSFQSKEAILAELFAESVDKFIAYVDSRIEDSDSGLVALRKLWESHLSMFDGPTDTYIIVSVYRYLIASLPADKHGPSLATEDSIGMIEKLIASILRRGKADGSLDPATDPERVARAALIIGMALLENAALHARGNNDSIDVVEEMRSTFNILLRGLAAKFPGQDLLPPHSATHDAERGGNKKAL